MKNEELSQDTKRFIVAVMLVTQVLDLDPGQVFKLMQWGAGIEHVLESGIGFKDPLYAAAIQEQYMDVAAGKAVPLFNADKSDFAIYYLPRESAESLKRSIENALVEAERP